MDEFVNIINSVNPNDIYVTYFLYRIWIKYRDLVLYSSSREDYNKVLKLLKIPDEYHTVNIIFPLNNFMFDDKKDEINKKILNAFVLIDNKMKNYKDIEGEEVPIKGLYDNFNKYIEELTKDISKIEDILNQFRKKLNLQYRNIYINGLNNN
jgi:hypothetical protein